MKKRGFTLIELLVVIAIIGILATIIIINYATAQARSRDNKRKGDIAAINSALELVYADEKKYIPSTASGQCLLSGILKIKSTENSWDCGINNYKPYIDSLPKDPINKDQYFYYVVAKNSTSSGRPGYFIYANKMEAKLGNAKSQSTKTTCIGEETSYEEAENFYYVCKE